MRHLDELREMIRRALSGEWTFQKFDYEFGKYFYEQLPVEVMRSEAASPYSAALEQLEFIKERPTVEEREEGWIDSAEYLVWLRENILPRLTPRDGSL